MVEHNKRITEISYNKDGFRSNLAAKKGVYYLEFDHGLVDRAKITGHPESDPAPFFPRAFLRLDQGYDAPEKAQEVASLVENLFHEHRKDVFPNEKASLRRGGMFHDAEQARLTIKSLADFAQAEKPQAMVTAIATGLGIPVQEMSPTDAKDVLDPGQEWGGRTWTRMESVIKLGDSHFMCVSAPYGAPEVHFVNKLGDAKESYAFASAMDPEELKKGISSFVNHACDGVKLGRNATALRETLLQEGLSQHRLCRPQTEAPQRHAEKPRMTHAAYGQVQLRCG